MKNLVIFSLQLIFLILLIINLKIVLREFLGPINLFKAQNFYVYKMTKVIIIYKDKNLILAAF